MLTVEFEQDGRGARHTLTGFGHTRDAQSLALTGGGQSVAAGTDVPAVTLLCGGQPIFHRPWPCVATSR
jgi:hypothetical protein